jgi:hypothetical protein
MKSTSQGCGPALIRGDVGSLLAALRRADVDEGSIHELEAKLAGLDCPTARSRAAQLWVALLKVCVAHGLSDISASTVNSIVVPIVEAWKEPGT